MGAIIECGEAERPERIADVYLETARAAASVLIVSQTWTEIHSINGHVRSRLKAASLLQGDEQMVSALEAIDLTAAQKQDPRYYPPDHLVVFNQARGKIARGAHGRMRLVTNVGVVVEVDGRIHLIKAKHADCLSVCRIRPLALCSGDRIQLKANGKATGGEPIANGEVVSVRQLAKDGSIDLSDGRTLPPSYRQFVHGYAVTSYGSQGKTVDHVLFSDSAAKAATNAQQWYVTISRGRKSVRIFTSSRNQLRENISRIGDRPLAMRIAAEGGVREHSGVSSLRQGRSLAEKVARTLARRERTARKSVTERTRP
jgi:hypothetical protein